MGKVIVCISGPSFSECQKQVAGKHTAELRLDLLDLSLDQISELWTEAEEWVLTLRSEFTTQKDWKATFKKCLSLNPLYVDIDSELENEIKLEAISWVNESTSDLILSYHNFKETPDADKLQSIISDLKTQGADVIKLACMAHDEDDNLKMIDLYPLYPRLVAFCMGEEGRESRVTSLFFGEKMTYAAPSENEVVAPGQLTYGELSDLLNLGFDDE